MTSLVQRATTAQAVVIIERARDLMHFMRQSGLTPQEGFEAAVVVLEMMHRLARPDARAQMEDLLRQAMVEMYKPDAEVGYQP